MSDMNLQEGNLGPPPAFAPTTPLPQPECAWKGCGRKSTLMVRIWINGRWTAICLRCLDKAIIEDERSQ